MQKRLILLLATITPCSLAFAQSPTASASTSTLVAATPNAVATLSLDEAIQLAKRNNPVHLSTLNNRAAADAAVRSAYGALLPSADASFSAQRQQGGRQIFNGGSFGANSDVNQSQYSIGIGYRLNSASLITPKLQRASRDAVEADITGSAETLRAQVVQQYLSILQAEDRAKLQDTLLVAAKSQVVLAQARALVGSATQLDVSRAEVAQSQQQVQVLQARNQIEIEKLKLFQLLGIDQPADVVLTTKFDVEPEPPPLPELLASAKARNQIEIEKLKLFQLLGIDQPADVVLTTKFDVEPEPPPLPELLASAKARNPVILALRSRERVANLNVKREKGEYSPTLSIQTGISGYTYAYTNSNFPIQQAIASAAESQASCIRTEEVRAALKLPNDLAGCGAIAVSDAQIADLRHQNSQFPFRFQNSPKSISAMLSLPLFDGFAREQRVQEAQVSSADARYNVRARELAIVADVTAAYLTLKTAEETSSLQEQNSAKAKLELKFTEDRYRNGQANFVDLVESRAAYERAESDRINANYDYHKAFAALESAVGRQLR